MNIVWEATVDKNTWRVVVTRTGDYTGTLDVQNVASGKVIHSEPVGLSYMAIFGPDAGDVYEWEEKAITAIDAYEENK